MGKGGAASARAAGMSGVTYVYDGTPEGLLTAVFFAYARREDPDDILRPEFAQIRLGQEVFEVQTDIKLALRVQRGISKACGDAVSDAVLATALSDDAGAGTAIYRFVRYALKKNAGGSCIGCKRKAVCGGACSRGGGRGVLSDVAHPEVVAFHALNRAVYNERHRIMQFLRFEHLQGDVWFARCNPKASVVPLVMDWFTGRFNTQNFMIYDEVHKIAGVYEGAFVPAAVLSAPPCNLAPIGIDSGSVLEGLARGIPAKPGSKARTASWYLVKTDLLQIPEHSAEEAAMQTAWKSFYDHVAVEARYNPELRRQFMPQRLWRNITEMKPDLP
ncbi:MAG: TIGR03915 family putative DNA repair protein [Raoultibacter sp.]